MATHTLGMPSLKLVPYDPSYLQSVIAWRKEPLAVRHNPFKEMSEDELGKMLAKAGTDLSMLENHELYSWFISVNGNAVGILSLKNISQSMSYGEIGYSVTESQQGQGIATAAVSLMVDKIFAESRLRRLLAYVHEENHASRRVLEKLGFQEEGLLREHYIIHGKPVNEVLYGLLKREWVSAK